MIPDVDPGNSLSRSFTWGESHARSPQGLMSSVCKGRSHWPMVSLASSLCHDASGRGEGMEGMKGGTRVADHLHGVSSSSLPKRTPVLIRIIIVN